MRSIKAAVGDLVFRVFHDGKLDSSIGDELGDVFGGLVGVGVDAEEDDALLAELALELDQAGHVQVAHRAVVPQKDEHDRLPALITVEHDRPLGFHVFEREVRQPLHESAIDRQLWLRVGRRGRDRRAGAIAAASPNK